MELDGLNSNAVLRKYTWGLDLSGTLQGAGGVGGLLAVYDTAGTTSTSDDASYGCLYDTNGNVGQLVDFADGSLAAKYEYDPYGGPLLDAGSASVSGAYAATNPFRFSTKYFDGEVDYSNTTNDGLYYYGYRYYSPRLGRWLSRDPLEEAGAVNINSFVQNAPTIAFDPYGLEPLSQSTTQPAQQADQACCQFRWIKLSGLGGTPTANRRQYTVKCTVKRSAKDCCECEVPQARNNLVSASFGACCSCQVEVWEATVGVFGGQFSPRHEKILVVCPDSSLDADVPGTQGGLGSSGISIGKVTVTSTIGFRLKSRVAVDCQCATKFMKQIRSQATVPYCVGIYDCRTYARNWFIRFANECFQGQ